MKLNWGRTFILGFGFLAISAVWPLYDSYMPKFYGDFISSSFLVGLIMGFDNLLGITLQPWFGSLSDRHRSRWGRRRPFLLIGMPLAALLVLLIPFGHSAGLAALVAITVTMNLAMSIFRSPTVALMPDLTPSSQRSLANGVINFMGGIGAAVVLLLGGKLYGMNPVYPFALSAGIMLVVFLLFLFFIREPEVPVEESGVEETPKGLWLALTTMVKNRDWEALILFLAMLAWSAGYQSVNTWFTTYSEQNLHVAVNVASQALTLYAGAFIIAAIPAGMIGSRLGRRRTITIGLIGMSAAFVVMNFLTTLGEMRIALVVAGLFWALININAYPMIADLCEPSQTGTYTGLYYIFTMAGGWIAPAVVGVVFDAWGSKRPLFAVATLLMLLAWYLLSRVRKGEAKGQVAAAKDGVA